jgi:Domain of unknown function (DUF3597)
VIFGRSSSAAATPLSGPTGSGKSTAEAATAASPTEQSAPAPAPATASVATVDVAAIMDSLAGQARQKLDWRHSIVDLMKLINLDSSLAARKELAQELHYVGDMNDSASMNIWLHKQVMTKLAENGGKVPDELRH